MAAFARINPGSETWRARSGIPRHRHAAPYAAVVLAGGYEEAGTFGRYRVRAGHVLLHRRFDAHLDRFASSGARVLNLLLEAEPAFGLGRVPDPEAIERLAARDPHEARGALRQQLSSVPAPAEDWPDLLARDLLHDRQLRLEAWAARHGLSPETLSRGFGQVFATTPASFRLELRTRAALALIVERDTPLAAVAAASGFADQAHMTRAVTALTGRPPGYWLRSNCFKTPRVPPT